MMTHAYSAQLSRAKLWKQPICLSVDEQIKKTYYIYTTKYYSAIKKDSFESYIRKWVDLEKIMLEKIRN